MSAEIQAFLNELQSEVTDRSSGRDGANADFKENVFTEYVMSMLADEVGIIEGAEACHFLREIGRGQAKINGFAIGEDAQDEESIDLFVTVYKGFSEVTRVPAEEMRKASEQAVRFFTAALDSLYAKLDPAQSQYQMAKRIHEFGPRLKNARLFVLTDGQTDFSRLKPTTLPIKDTGVQLRIDFWDVERLSRVVGSGNPQSEIEIDLLAMNGEPLPSVTAIADEHEYQAFVTIIPGTLLFKMYDEYGPALLQRNVRSFLQAKGKVNKGIRDSLKQQPGRFLAYNNGISLTADSVETTGSGAAVGITRIRGLQIVNGGQTTASIHQAGKTKCDLSRVFVQAKLTVLKPEVVDTLAPQIAQYANTQNPIQMADFSANDPFHIEFERLSTVTWAPGGQARWFYERTRGQYFVELNRLGKGTAKERRFLEAIPKHRRLSKLDVAKFINAWEHRPDQVSLGGQKNFVRFTQRTHETRARTWKPDERYYKETIAKAILFNEASRCFAATKYKEVKSQFGAYVVAALASRTDGQIDLMHIWQYQRLSPQLEALIARWVMPIGDRIAAVATEHIKSPSEWSKKPECWKDIQHLALPDPETGTPEFEKVELSGATWGVAPTEKRVALDPDEMDARQRCRQIDPTDWIRIIRWGTESGMLDPKQKETASEIALCAASGWRKELSAKKVMAAREIINMAVNDGALGEAVVA